jgi:copper oxidase (laccase) domain-containing protein
MHIGWRGLVNDLYEKVSSLFNQENLEVYVGPFLHSFEIQKDYCYDVIIKKFGDKFIEESSDGISFDFYGAIKSILPKNAIFDERDTKDDLTLPSNRRDGTKDRLLTIISLK